MNYVIEDVRRFYGDDAASHDVTIDYETVQDRCPTCGSSGPLAPCYEGREVVPDHDGRPILGVIELQDGGR